MTAEEWFADRPALQQCHGNGAEHCCWVNGHECDFLLVGVVPGRHWACGLREELGDWDLVHADPRYLASVKTHWLKTGTADCGDWKVPGQCCFSPDNPPVYNQGT